MEIGQETKTRILYILSFEVEYIYSIYIFEEARVFLHLSASFHSSNTDNSSLSYLQDHEFNTQHWPEKINA